MSQVTIPNAAWTITTINSFHRDVTKNALADACASRNCITTTSQPHNTLIKLQCTIFTRIRDDKKQTRRIWHRQRRAKKKARASTVTPSAPPQPQLVVYTVTAKQVVGYTAAREWAKKKHSHSQKKSQKNNPAHSPTPSLTGVCLVCLKE